MDGNLIEKYACKNYETLENLVDKIQESTHFTPKKKIKDVWLEASQFLLQQFTFSQVFLCQDSRKHLTIKIN